MSKRSYFYFKQIVSEFSRSNKIKNSAQIFEDSLVQEGRHVCVPPVKMITSSNQLHGIMLIVNMCFPQGCASCRLSDNSHGADGWEVEGLDPSFGSGRISQSGRRGGRGDRCDSFRQPCGVAVLECVRHIRSCLSGGVSTTVQNPGS